MSAQAKAAAIIAIDEARAARRQIKEVSDATRNIVSELLTKLDKAHLRLQAAEEQIERDRVALEQERLNREVGIGVLSKGYDELRKRKDREKPGGGFGFTQADILALIDANPSGDPAGTAATLIAAHEAESNPHPTYLTQAEGDARYDASGAVAAHEAAADPHTGYQRESEKDAANGYCGLDAGGLVAKADLPTSVAYEDEANTFTESQSVVRSANGGTSLGVTNTNSGTAALAAVFVSNDGAGGYLGLDVTGTGYTTSGGLVQDAGVIDCGAGLSGGLTIAARVSPMRFYVGGVAAGNLVFSMSGTTITLSDAINIAANATTGTKIGTATTQKLGFYNATPIAQRAGAAQAAVATTGATNVAPFGFTTAAQANAIVTLVNELRDWAVAQGFIKGSA